MTKAIAEQTRQDIAVDLPTLTPREHAFVDAFIRSVCGELTDEHGDPVTTLVGIRKAAGYATENCSMAAQYVDASRLAKRAKIKLWLDYLLTEYRECTLESYLERMKRLSIKAERNNDITNARQCEEARAKAAGVIISRHEVTNFDARTKDDVQKYLEDSLGLAIETKQDKSGTYVPDEPSTDSVEPGSAD